MGGAVHSARSSNAATKTRHLHPLAGRPIGDDPQRPTPALRWSRPHWRVRPRVRECHTARPRTRLHFDGWMNCSVEKLGAGLRRNRIDPASTQPRARRNRDPSLRAQSAISAAASCGDRPARAAATASLEKSTGKCAGCDVCDRQDNSCTRWLTKMAAGTAHKSYGKDGVNDCERTMPTASTRKHGHMGLIVRWLIRRCDEAGGDPVESKNEASRLGSFAWGAGCEPPEVEWRNEVRTMRCNACASSSPSWSRWHYLSHLDLSRYLGSFAPRTGPVDTHGFNSVPAFNMSRRFRWHGRRRRMGRYLLTPQSRTFERCSPTSTPCSAGSTFRAAQEIEIHGRFAGIAIGASVYRIAAAWNRCA